MSHTATPTPVREEVCEDQANIWHRNEALVSGAWREPDGRCVPHFHLRPTPGNMRLSALGFPTSVLDPLNTEYHVRTAGVMPAGNARGGPKSWSWAERAAPGSPEPWGARAVWGETEPPVHPGGPVGAVA